MTIAQPFTAPAGYGVLASGSTLSVASGGSGYIAAPVVMFSAPSGGGVRATGLATIDANGAVTGITITSPGSGYALNESVTITYNGGGNTSGAAVSVAPSFTVNASTLNASGGFQKLGSGTLTLTGSNTYAGVNTLSAGVVSLGLAETAGTSGPLGRSAASNPGNIVLAGGTLQYSTANQFDYSGRFSTADNQAYNVDTNGQSVTWATNLSSSGGTLTKSGSGTLALTGSNSYTGATTLSAGQLNLGNASAIGTGTFTLASGTLGNASGSAVTLSANNPVSITGDFSFAGPSDLNLGTGAVSVSGTRQITVTAGGLTIGGVIATSTAGLVKAGPATLVLTASNSYAGGTTIQNGTLVLAGGSNRLLTTSAVVLGAASTSGRLVLGDAAATSDQALSSLTATGSGGSVVGGNGAANSTLSLAIATSSTFAGTLGGASTNENRLALRLTSGTLSLTGSNSYAGGTVIAGPTAGAVVRISQASNLGTGNVSFSGTGAAIEVTGANNPTLLASNTVSLAASSLNTITVTDAGNTFTIPTLSASTPFTKDGAGTLRLQSATMNNTTVNLTRGTLLIGSGDTFTLGNLTTALMNIGTTAGVSASLVQTGGTFNGSTANANSFNVGGANSFGYYSLRNATFTNHRAFNAAGGALTSGTGVVQVLAGGNLDLSRSDAYLWFARNNASGQLTVAGGTVSFGGPTSQIGVWAGGRGEVNIGTVGGDTGGSFISTNAYDLIGNNATGSGVISLTTLLSGGTLRAPQVLATLVAGGTATAVFSFNGGTLRYGGATTQASFFPGTNVQTLVYSGGATIDDGGQSITIAESLEDPGLGTGSQGITSIPVTNGGSGYIGAPYVRITDSSGGLLATGVAVLQSGSIANIQITSPGQGYTNAGTITVTLVGGTTTSTAAATLGTPTIGTNVSGGLTKIGAGALTLSGSSTYSGSTTISTGTLALGHATPLPNSTVSVTSGATLVAGTSASPTSHTIGGLTGSGTVRLSGNTLQFGVNNADTTFSGVVSGSSGSGFVKLGVGTTTLTGASTITGTLTAGEGVLSVATVGGTAAANPLGQGTVGLGAGTTVGTLRYTGGGETSARQFVLPGSAGGGGAIEANGSGALKLLRSGTVVSAASGDKTFTLTGTSLADNEIGVIANPSSGTTSLVKAGSGRWVLSGSNTFSGDVSVNEGQLVLAISAEGSNGSLGSFSNAAITIGSAAGSGTAALLFKSGVIVGDRKLTIPQVTSGSQAVVIGAVDGSGTATFGTGSLPEIALGRDVTLQAATNGTLVFRNAWSQASGTSVSVTIGSADNAGTVVIGQPLAATGSVRIDRGTLRLTALNSATGSLASAASVVVGTAGSVNTVLDLAQTGSSAAYVFGAGQTLSGIGTIQLDTDTPVSVAGFFRPGNSPGIFTFQGDGSGGATTLSGTTFMEITGTTVGTSYDQIKFTSGATLDYGSGSLLLDLTGLYADNTQFQLFDFGTTGFSGSLSTISGSGSYGLLTFVRGTNGVWTSGSTSQPNQTFTFTESTGTLVVVPEPATLALAAVGIGLAGWAAIRRRK